MGGQEMHIHGMPCRCINLDLASNWLVACCFKLFTGNIEVDTSALWPSASFAFCDIIDLLLCSVCDEAMCYAKDVRSQEC